MVSAWVTHVKQVYAAGKKKSASYKFSQAMKDAKKTYKKTATAPKKRGRKKKAK